MATTAHNPQVVLVTGASSGIGKATALRLIEEGHVVYGAARRIDKMQDLVAAGGHAVALDVTDPEAIERTVAQVFDEHGHIDVLINNAGYATYGSVEETPLDDARRQFEVNVFGLAAITRAVLPHMRERGSGRIINVSSVGGKIYTPLGAWYHATKHAVEGWSDSLRLEVGPFGIDVVIVEPGLIKTEFGDVMTQPMLERSGRGPYAELARTIAAVSEGAEDRGASHPDVIAEVISKAIRAKHPKTRYAAGKLAKPILGMRRWLSDRMFDRVIMSQVR